ncbi:MAG: hypothetical protein JWN30_1635, partial [Bacilli bacterium]|nr:hypothetical protein [Bacilli bacterium]
MAVKSKRNLQARIEEQAVVEFMQKCQQSGMSQAEVLYRMVRIFNLFGPNLFDLLSVETHLPAAEHT